MPLTQSTDLVFENQIALDHALAYFDRKLGWVNLLWRGVTELMNRPGKKVTFPYFNTIGAAESPAEGVAYALDKLDDNQFDATVKLVGKAVGISEEAEVRAGFSLQPWYQEAIQQMEQRHAEKVQDDVIAMFNLPASHDEADFTSNVTFTSAFDGKKNIDTQQALDQRLNVRSLRRGEQQIFGDKRSQVFAYVMHSLQMVDLETDKEAGLMKADANSPYQYLDGLKYIIMGKPIFEFDDVPKGDKVTFTDSGGVTQKFQSYKMLAVKRDPGGLLVKRDLRLKEGEDIRKRQKMLVSSRWYAIVNFHKRISNLDRRTGMLQFLTTEQTT